MTIAPNRPAIKVETKKVICPHDCPDTCCMTATIEDGRVTKVGGAAPHPFTKGFLCVKTSYYQERLYSPLRVLSAAAGGAEGQRPVRAHLLGRGHRPDCRAFKDIIAEHGAEAILPYSYAGTMGLKLCLDGPPLFPLYGRVPARPHDLLDHRGEGSPNHGRPMGTDPESIANAKLIIAWGTNPVSTNVHLMPFIHEAKKRGAMLVVVDPHKSRPPTRPTFIQPNPGTDAALALAMIHVIIEENLHDQAFSPATPLALRCWPNAPRIAARTRRADHRRPGPADPRLCPALRHDETELYPPELRHDPPHQRRADGAGVTCCRPWSARGGRLAAGRCSAPAAPSAQQCGPGTAHFLRRHERYPRTINMIQLGEALLDTKTRR